MKKLFIAVMCISNLYLPANAQPADNLGNFLAADAAANTIAASNAGGGCFFLHGPKKPKIKYLANGNIVINGKEYTPATEAAAIISASAPDSGIYQDENVEVKFAYHPGIVDVSKAGSNSREANQYVTVLVTNKSQTKILRPNADSVLLSTNINIKDNYGNKFSGIGSMLGSSYNGIYPGETREWKIYIHDKLVSTASSLELSISPNSFGNDKSFEINVPLKPAGGSPLVSTQTQH